MSFNLKNKTDEEKKTLALVIAGIVTVVIAGVWFSFMFDRAKSAVAESTESGFAFWGNLKENISNAYSGFSEKAAPIKEQISQFKEYSAKAEQ